MMISIIAVVVASISLLLFSPWIYSFFQPTPPQPVIKYGEFPFKLEYEINGRIVVVEDTIICKYKGIGVSFGTEGKYLKWESYLASEGKSSTDTTSGCLLVDDVNQIYFSLSGAKYYLGYLSEYYPELIADGPNFYAFATNDSDRWLRPDEILNKYSIRIISFEPSPPIQNTFK